MLLRSRVESYSCKMAGDPKKLYKQLRNEPGTDPRDLEILGPSQTKSPTHTYTLMNSPPAVIHSNPLARSISSDDESPLAKTIPRKTVIFLISTLNASFEPDYEFSSCTSQDFSRETNVDVDIPQSSPRSDVSFCFASASEKCRRLTARLSDGRSLPIVVAQAVVGDRRGN